MFYNKRCAVRVSLDDSDTRVWTLTVAESGEISEHKRGPQNVCAVVLTTQGSTAPVDGAWGPS